MDVQQNGLCIIRDQYFLDFPSTRHMDNKHERRPYYLAVKEENGIIWVVPISHKVDKYREKMARDSLKHGDSVFCHIGKIKGEERAFLTGNVIPVSKEYIKNPFTIQGIPYVVQDKRDIREIQTKTRKYLALVRIGKLRPCVDILGIEQALLNKMKNYEYMI